MNRGGSSIVRAVTRQFVMGAGNVTIDARDIARPATTPNVSHRLPTSFPSSSSSSSETTLISSPILDEISPLRSALAIRSVRPADDSDDGGREKKKTKDKKPIWVDSSESNHGAPNQILDHDPRRDVIIDAKLWHLAVTRSLLHEITEQINEM